MSGLRSVLSLSYPALRVGKAIRRSLRPSVPPDLRVLLYHDVAPDMISAFRRQLEWLKQRWRFLSPAEFEAIVDGEAILDRDSVLLTFDDGFASNRLLADQVLVPLEIRAIFFVVTDFIDQSDRLSARRFICDRLKAGTAPDALPAHWTNLSWDDVGWLADQGHLIGAHTGSHERLAAGVPEALLRQEIIGGADRLQARLGRAVRHFAFPFGNFTSFSERAMSIAAERFSYVYSGLRGNNLPNGERYAIRRDSQTASEDASAVGAFLEGAVDFRYRSSNSTFDRWAAKIRTGSIGN